ncbi:MAG: nitroreductase family protein [Victivallaceae bacterium]|nr:nitroreductase family protein [Victivallaceae bacterium]
MEFSELLKKRRTIRRFKQVQVFDKDIRYILEAARVVSCGGNVQKIHYIVARDKQLVKDIFDNTTWAGLVSPDRNPEWGKNAPLTFIILTAPEDSGSVMQANAGAAVQSMEYAAEDVGLGACWIGAFKKDNVEKLLGLPEQEETLYIMAIGYPDEEPVQEDIDSGESMKYYLDGDDVLHVPKFKTEAIADWR